MIVQIDENLTAEVQDILSLTYNPDERVYSYFFVTRDREIKSSPGHSWFVWDDEEKEIKQIKTEDLKIEKHKLLVINKIQKEKE